LTPVGADGESVLAATQDSRTHKLEIYSAPTGGGDDWRRVYVSKTAVTAYETAYQADGLYFMEVTAAKSGNQFTVYLLGGGTYDALYSAPCDQLPEWQVVQAATATRSLLRPRVLLCFTYAGQSEVMLLGPADSGDAHPTYIARSAFTADADGTWDDGRCFSACGGYGDVIYYQALDNSPRDPGPGYPQIFETTGTATLYRYRISDATTERVAALSPMAQWVGGSEALVLASEYDYFAPLDASGRVFLPDDPDRAFAIPGVFSGNDIRQAWFLSPTRCIIATPEALYGLDLSRKTLNTCDVADLGAVQCDGERLFALSGSGESATVQTLAVAALFGE
jgi:hypothetical protein